MSNKQGGFFGKVSNGIKKRIFDDEQDVASDSLLIKRLQSIAESESSGQSEKPGFACSFSRRHLKIQLEQ